MDIYMYVLMLHANPMWQNARKCIDSYASLSICQHCNRAQETISIIKILMHICEKN